MVPLDVAGYARPSQVLFSPGTVNFYAQRRTESATREITVPVLEQDGFSVTSVSSTTSASLRWARHRARIGRSARSTYLPDDPAKAGFTGEWSLTVRDPTTVKLDIRELTLNMLLSGQTMLLPETIKTTRVVSLNRTYILGGTAIQQDKKTTLRLLAVCVTPGG